MNIKKGFTLIELLVVIVIISILIGMSVFGIQGARKNSRDARRKSDLEQLRSALELYRADNGGYVCYDDDGDGDCQITQVQLGGGGGAATDFTDKIVTTGKYMADIPVDPNANNANPYCIDTQNYGYFYYVSVDATTYEIVAGLENEMTSGDPDLCDCGGTEYLRCYSVTNP